MKEIDKNGNCFYRVIPYYIEITKKIIGNSEIKLVHIY